MVLWVLAYGRLTTVKELAAEVALGRPDANGVFSEANGVRGEEAYILSVDRFHEESSALSDFLVSYRLLLCWYTVLLMVRFFGAFSAQPRLAIVTQTVARAGLELFHFMVVFFVIFFSYAIAGMFMFGRRLVEWSETYLAVNQAFQILFGDFDFTYLAEENPVTARLWFVSFLVMVMLILLNMVLAIILDTYTEVKTDANKSVPIWSELADLCQQLVIKVGFFKETGELKLTDVMAAVEMAEDNYRFNEDTLGEMLPLIPQAQAKRFIEECMDEVANEEEKGLTISEAMKMIGNIKMGVQRVGQKLDMIVDAEKQEVERLRREISNEEEASDARSSSQLLEEPPPISEKQTYSLAATTLIPEMHSVRERLGAIEAYVGRSMADSTVRAKDMRQRLSVIEDLLQGQHEGINAVHLQASDLWEEQVPRIPPFQDNENVGEHGG